MLKGQWILLVLAAMLAAAGGWLIAQLFPEGSPTGPWFAAALLIFLALVSLALLYRMAGPSRLLGGLIAGAFLLRLVLGITLMKALPVYGYGSEPQKAGYVFYDAYRRDRQAQEIARTDVPWTAVFNKEYSTDQYGGYLGASVLIYRALSREVSRPYLMLILSAWISAVGVPFLWMVLRRLDQRSWRLPAGLWYVLYPEAVLLGSSQMRDPYLITFVTLVLWAILEIQQASRPPGWIWLAVGLAGLLLFSPGVVAAGLVIPLGWVWMSRARRKPRWWLILLAFGVVALGIILLAYALSEPTQLAAGSPLAVILSWLREASTWDLSQTLKESGMLTYQLKVLPRWAQQLFISLYGLLQPVLPATLMDPAVWIWRSISSVLGFGWYLLLPLLIYGTFAAFHEREDAEGSRFLWLAAALWTWTLLSSVRGGGDMWDNPRYRAILLVYLALFAAWAWDRARRHHFRWLKRIALVEGIFLAFFLQWYASRYTGLFGRMPFFRMIAIILALAGLVVAGGWWRDRRTRREPRAGSS